MGVWGVEKGCIVVEIRVQTNKESERNEEPIKAREEINEL